jgi:hypothetical protein
MSNNDKSFEIKPNTPDWFLRVGDWVRLWTEDLGFFNLRVKKLVISGGLQVITVGKKVFTASKIFGDYLRKEIQLNAQPLQVDNITAFPQNFTIKKDNFNKGGWRCYYEESVSPPSDGQGSAWVTGTVYAKDTWVTQSGSSYLCLQPHTAGATTQPGIGASWALYWWKYELTLGAFVDVIVNGAIVPPGRIKLIDGGSIKIDITDYCLTSATIDQTNTISHGLHLATGWTSSGATVKQYSAMAILN